MVTVGWLSKSSKSEGLESGERAEMNGKSRSKWVGMWQNDEGGRVLKAQGFTRVVRRVMAKR